MKQSDNLVNLIEATIKVMEAVKGIDKSMVIGSGQNTYKGVPDQEVKKIIGEAMAKNGLAIFPIGIEETTQLSEWDETNQYGTKRKQSIFTKVTTTYLLTHKSGEYITLQGYGHGVDSQDKSAGKATTYALKYALLYTFLTPTGKIDDSDSVHSEEIEVPKKSEIKKAENLTDQTKDENRVTTWMTEKVFQGIKVALNSPDSEMVKKGVANFKGFKNPPYGMKKQYRDELETIIKTNNIEVNE